MTSTRLPTLMIAHGGGPCFFMDPPPGQPPGLWDNLAAHLRGLAAEVGRKPKAVLVISAHWETRVPTVLASANPSLLYDYYGFPPHTYALQYPAPGSPALAARVRDLLGAAQIETAADMERGLDHGCSSPLC